MVLECFVIINTDQALLNAILARMFIIWHDSRDNAPCFEHYYYFPDSQIWHGRLAYYHLTHNIPMEVGEHVSLYLEHCNIFVLFVLTLPHNVVFSVFVKEGVCV